MDTSADQGQLSPEAKARLLKALVELDKEGSDGDQPGIEKLLPKISPEDAKLVAEELNKTSPPQGFPISADPSLPSIPGYEMIEVIARGGMGEVYKARQLSLNRIVAVKMILSVRYAGPQQRARFRTEAEATARLQHPNIVQVYEVGEHEGRPFLALEYVEGGSLAQRLAGAPQPPAPAAQLVEALARAVHYAHERGVVHRDLKPANLLLVSGGVVSGVAGATTHHSLLSTHQPKITDFGLAKQLLSAELPGELPVYQTQTGEILGTPSYMAPEQADGKVRDIGPATDVYALGAILYELLTGRPPFKGQTILDTLEQVRTQEPVPPSRLQPRLPRDLSTICLKALEKNPARRYATAAELADDLHRFLDGKSIQARPAGRFEKLGRWCRRNPVVAALTAATALLLLALVIAALAAAVAAQGREEEALARARDQERESLLQQIQLLREGGRIQGWSAEAWKRVLKAAHIGTDSRLRSQAAGALAGFDAHEEKHFKDQPASSVAFDASGTRLLLGGTLDSKGGPAEGAKLWDASTDKLVYSSQVGPGPVAFAPDGTPLQLLTMKKAGLMLWDVASQKAVSECRFDQLADELPVPWENVVMAMSADGSLVAASAPVSKATGQRAIAVAVWEGASGKRHFQLNLDARALAFSRDKRLLAAGAEDGRVTIWSVLDGKQVLGPFEATRQAIHCLAFSPNGRWLAVGGGGGTLTIWDWRDKRQICACRGSSWDVFALAFSPDGAILASGGRYDAKLWDVGSGRLLLDLGGSDFATGLAFSPDARRLAVSNKFGFAQGQVRIWKLDYGRGIQTLLGLSSHVDRLRFSADGKRLAALSHDWQVAIWDLDSGFLKLLLEVPRGSTADNAALTFSPDGRRLAFATRTDAQLWDVDTGKMLRDWKLPPGFQDALAFHPSGKLLSFRCETRDKKPICFVRHLFGPKWSEPIAQVSSCTQHVYSIVAPPHGRYFVVDGVGVDQRRLLGVFDGITGKELWLSHLWRWHVLDPTGTVMGVNDGDKHCLLEMPSGRSLGSYYPMGNAMSPSGRYSATGSAGAPGEPPRLSLFRRGQPTPVVVFPTSWAPNAPAFNVDGRLLAWGNPDGSISLCDLAQVRKRLAEAELGW